MSSGTSTRTGRAKRTVRGAAAVLAVGVVLAACGSSPASSSGHKGGSIYFAEAPGANPNYIFPYMGCKYFSVATINQFQLEPTAPRGRRAAAPASTEFRGHPSTLKVKERRRSDTP